jgi:hypothetical protein
MAGKGQELPSWLTEARDRHGSRAAAQAFISAQVFPLPAEGAPDGVQRTEGKLRRLPAPNRARGTAAATAFDGRRHEFIG